VRLSLNENQRCWKEEVPNFGMTGFIDKRRNEYCDGYLERGGETIDYILYLRTGVLWLRYRGDHRFYQGWSSCTYRVVRNKGYAVCPFCWSGTRDLYVWTEGLRCSACFDTDSRYRRQQWQTTEERKAIENGNLDKIATQLQSGSYSQKYSAIIAMEMTGIIDRKYTITREKQEWKFIRKPRLIHQEI